MTAITLGEATISSLVEIDRSSFPTPSMLPESTAEGVARHLSWLKPHFFDERTGDIGSRIQTFIVRTPEHLLLSPTVATVAFEHGILYPSTIDGKAVSREASSAFTFPFNMTGEPSASVPCGFTRDGLPIGLQITGRRFEDVTVLRASAALEAARPRADRRPAIG